jgi:hypothetical protein
MDLEVILLSIIKTYTMPTTMTTLSGVLEKLRQKKQDNEFIMTEELTIIKTYRFEGDSDPSDNTILYLIEAHDGLIGYSIDIYGADSNHDDVNYDEFIRKINVSERDEQEIFKESAV